MLSNLFSLVDVNQLSCPVEEEVGPPEEEPSTVSPESTDICGSDGETYSSLCQLIQTTSNVRVAHAGPCDSPDCQTGEVRVQSRGVGFRSTHPCIMMNYKSTWSISSYCMKYLIARSLLFFELTFNP